MYRNQQNLYPRIPTAVARLLQYSGLRSNSGMGFLHAINELQLSEVGVSTLDLGFW